MGQNTVKQLKKHLRFNSTHNYLLAKTRKRCIILLINLNNINIIINIIITINSELSDR